MLDQVADVVVEAPTVMPTEHGETSDEAVLGERIEPQTLKMTKPKALLLVYALCSLCLAVLIAGLGLVSFNVMADLNRSNSMRIELKWVNLVLLFRLSNSYHCHFQL